jgi:phenylalanyl-tRNA synthetase beta chain
LRYDDVALFSPNIVRTQNSVSEDMEAMRPSLAPSMLKIVAHNINRGNADLRLFEVAHVFEIDKNDTDRNGEQSGALVKGYIEKEMLCFAVTGKREPRRWAQSNGDADFYDAKGAAESLLQRLHLLEKTKFIPYTPNALRLEFSGAEGNAAAGQFAGMIYVAPKEILMHYDIRQPVFWAELDMAILKTWSSFERTYKEPAIYPAVWRDLAFFVPKSAHSRDLIEEMRKTNALIDSIDVFDVYEGGTENGKASGKRSVAFSLKLVSYERTLTEQDIGSLLTNVIERVESKFGAELRQA